VSQNLVSFARGGIHRSHTDTLPIYLRKYLVWRIIIAEIQTMNRTDLGATQQILAKDGSIVMSKCVSLVGNVRRHQTEPTIRCLLFHRNGFRVEEIYFPYAQVNARQW